MDPDQIGLIRVHGVFIHVKAVLSTFEYMQQMKNINIFRSKNIGRIWVFTDLK